MVAVPPARVGPVSRSDGASPSARCSRGGPRPRSNATGGRATAMGSGSGSVDTWAWMLELRAEGALAVDPSGELTDRAFPGSGFDPPLRVAATRRSSSRNPGGGTRRLDRHRVGSDRDLHRRASADRVFAVWRRGLRKAHRENPDRFPGGGHGPRRGRTGPRVDGALLLHAAAARYAPRAELVACRDAGSQARCSRRRL